MPRDTSTPTAVAEVVVLAGSERVRPRALPIAPQPKGLLLFPRINSALSAYLKDPRNRTRASLALAVAAAAGMSTASAVGAEPWAGSLNTMALAAHGSTGTADQAGTNLFDTARYSQPSGHPAGQQGASVTGKQAPQATHAKLADQKQPAPAHAGQPQRPSAGHATLGILRALQPLPVHHAAVQHKTPAKPAARVRPAAAIKHAAAVKPAAGHRAAPPGKPAAHLPAVPHRAAPPPPPPKPYTIYDSVTPTSIPSSQHNVAVYADGKFQASWSDVHGREKVLWIDVHGNNSGCDVLDVEPGDATPSGAADWARQRLTQRPNSIAIVYTMRSEWQQVKDAIGALPGQMQSHVRYWIADPTGVPHVVPGSSATQWYWGSHFDITTALPEFNH